MPQRRWRWSSHIAVFLIPVVVLAVNAFWWLPGIWLASTKGESGFVFAHLEGASGRLLNIVAGREARIEIILMALGIPGLVLLVRRDRAKGVALLGFCVAGLFWGYLAADFRALDFLQPGRHTYAFYSGLALAGGAALDELFRRLRVVSKGVDRFDRWVMAGAITSALLMFGLPVVRFGLLTTVGGGAVPVEPSVATPQLGCRSGAPSRGTRRAPALRGGGIGHSRRPRSVPGRTVQRPAPPPGAGDRGHRRSLLACIVEDELHPVR